MTSAKSVVKAIVLAVSGIAIIVVGGFMMGAIARLWSPKEEKNQTKTDLKNDPRDKKTD